jgi:ABC-2 type transport system permease protein
MAAWLFLVFALALTFPLIITVVWLGEPDPGAMACGYSGCILMGGAYLAISCMTSAMTGSQVVSFIVSELICVFLIFAGWTPIRGMLVKWAPLWLIDSVESMSVMPHFASMRRGVVDTRDIVYFLSVIVFSMFVTVVLLKNHRS